MLLYDHPALCACSYAQVLHAYGKFSEDVLFDPEKGMALTDRARRAEELSQYSKTVSLAEQSVGEAIDVPLEIDDNNAMITVSGSLDNLGEILSANAKLLTTLGCRNGSQFQQRVAVLFPGAVGKWVMQQLRGEGLSPLPPACAVPHFRHQALFSVPHRTAVCLLLRRQVTYTDSTTTHIISLPPISVVLPS